MKKRQLGSSDMYLPVVTFGAWAIGGTFWGGSDDGESIDAIRAAVDNGTTAIDTAPIYGCGHSEEVVGRALVGRRDKVQILTKCGLRWDSTEGEFDVETENPDGSTFAIYKNLRADSIIHECEQSLKRLRTDVIDLYQVHWPSSSAAADETMSALVQLQEQGKIRAIGVSNYSPSQLKESLQYASVASNQIPYSLLNRKIESEILPFCRENAVGVLVYSPMHLGLLTGKVSKDRTFPRGDVRAKGKWYQPANRALVLEALESIRDMANHHGATLAQMAVAWTLHQPGITTALVGARTRQQAIENAGSATLQLSESELQFLSATFSTLVPSDS